MEMESSSFLTFLYCYANEDLLLCQELDKQLSSLKALGHVSIWHGQKIPETGSRIFDISSIILLLLSPDFLSSDVCRFMMQEAITRHRNKSAYMIPIVLRPVDWEMAPLKEFQALPTNTKPVTMWTNIDEAFLDVARGIRRVIASLLDKRSDLTGTVREFRAWTSNRLISLEEAESTTQKIRAFCDEGIVFDPTNELFYKIKADTYIPLVDTKKAADVYLQALQFNPENHVFYIRRGDIFSRDVNYQEEALIAYSEALTLSPDNIDIHLKMGEIFFNLKRYKEALEVYGQVLHLDSDNHSACKGYYDIGNEFFALKRYEEAIVAYDHRWQWPDPDRYLKKGDALFALKRYEEAVAAYEQALIPLLDITVLEQYQEATYEHTSLDHLSDLDLCNEKRRQEIGKQYRETGKQHEEAVAAYEQATSGPPPDFNPIFLARKQYQETLATYKQALYNSNFDPNLFHKEKEVLFTLKRYEEALVSRSRATWAHFSDPDFHRKKNGIFFRLKQYEEALVALEVVSAHFLDPDFHCKKGDALFALKRYEEALVAYEQALSLDPDGSYSDSIYNDNSFVLTRFIKTLAVLGFVSVRIPDPNFYRERGDIFFILKRYEEAAAAYKQALVHIPDPDLHCKKGDVLYILQRYEEAVAAYEQALSLDPSDPNYCHLAIKMTRLCLN